MLNSYQGTAGLPLTGKPSGKVKINAVASLSSVYNYILNLGSKYAEAKGQGKYIRISNFIMLNGIAGSLIFIVCAVIWKDWDWLVLLLPLGLLSIAGLVMNNYGRINLSRLIFFAGINILIFLDCLFEGPASESKNFFIITLIIPFLVYDIRDFIFIATGVALPVFFSYVYNPLAPYFSAYNLPVEQQLVVSKINMAVEFLLALSAVYQFVYYSRKAEAGLEESNRLMTLQTKELKRSNADLEQFAYIISHDLKTPVRNISSFMTLLANKHGTTLNAEAREFVNFSVNGAKRMERLIDDLLSYCRIGTNLPQPVPVNLDEVVNTLRIELKDKLNAVNGGIFVSHKLPVINNVHPTLMYHLFQNLVTNGLKFNKSGKPEIKISCTESADYYTFSVSDNGIGISKEYSKAIFQMFKRLHTETEYEGTGIGLAICKRVVETYHGEIWFDSEAGHGTTFHFTIRKF